MKKIRQQIYDGKGNLFVPTAVQERLSKAGWRIVERRKMGCVWIVKWADAKGGMVWPQGTAIEILKSRQKEEAK